MKKSNAHYTALKMVVVEAVGVVGDAQFVAEAAVEVVVDGRFEVERFYLLYCYHKFGDVSLMLY